MKFKMVHNNFNVADLEKSMKFYAEAFDLHEVKRIAPEDGSFIIVYLANSESSHRLELTWVKEMEGAYNLGDNEFHLAFETDDYESAHALHEKMGCICYENTEVRIFTDEYREVRKIIAAVRRIRAVEVFSTGAVDL